MVFEIANNQKRFALHIENKKSNGRFLEGQAEAYRVRAQHMANQAEYLNYEAFETILIAPRSFITKYGASCGFFDSIIPYEDVARFVPEFVGLSEGH